MGSPRQSSLESMALFNAGHFHPRADHPLGATIFVLPVRMPNTRPSGRLAERPKITRCVCTPVLACIAQRSNATEGVTECGMQLRPPAFLAFPSNCPVEILSSPAKTAHSTPSFPQFPFTSPSLTLGPSQHRWLAMLKPHRRTVVIGCGSSSSANGLAGSAPARRRPG